MLKDKYLSVPGFDVIDILMNCVSDVRGLLSAESRRNASSLLKRLKPESVPVNSLAAVHSQHSSTHVSSNKHIMLSYSWAVNKHLVIAVGQKLRQLGYDVWRDEEGSKILGPMAGDTDEKMAAAIEAAHTVVIFVSPQYKESGNCRTEAKYSKQRQLVCPLKILYVMMCENYHTRSNPPVDGWLALNIGTDLWYPLWHDSMVDTTSMAIAELAGGAAAAASATLAPINVPMTSVVSVSPGKSTGGSAGGVDLDTAWTVLNDPNNAITPGSVADYMNKVGLTEKDELMDLDEADLFDMSALLKQLKQKKFLGCMNKHK